jgi:hypothetical protein
MALPATDTFTGEENPLATNWTTITGCNALQKTGGYCCGTAGGVVNGAYWDADAFDDDQYSQADFLEVYDNTAVAVRISASANTEYYFGYVGSGNFKLLKSVAGSETQLGSTYAPTFSAGDCVGIKVVGTTITPYTEADGDLATRTDSAIASGAAGLWNYQSAVMKWDNWEGGNVGGGGVSYFPDDRGINRGIGRGINRGMSRIN